MPMFSEQDNPASFSPYLLTRYNATNQTKVFKSVVLTLFFPCTKMFYRCQMRKLVSLS